VVRNAEATILDTLKSVASQIYPHKEHWVLDGKSTDRTLEIVQDFAKDHEHIKILSEKDAGMYHALNRGISLATGDVVGFLHADDFYAKPTVLEEVAAAWREDIEGVYSDLLYVDPTDISKVRRVWKSKTFKQGDFSKGWCPPHPTLFIKRAVYDKLGGFDVMLPIGNDVELMMRYFERHQITTQYCPGVWVIMRMGGISNRSFKNIIRQNRVIMHAFKVNQIPFSWIHFVIGKMADRFKQFFFKSGLDLNHVRE
jgi:glycosyltransferase involved in cell wall biosynthesis